MTDIAQPVAVRRASVQDLDRVADVLAKAFANGDKGSWLIPDGHVRSRLLRPWFTLLTKHALAYGHVHVTTDGEAVAVSFMRGGNQTVPDIPGYNAYVEQLFGTYASGFRALNEVTELHHPPDTKHHYLQFLGVLPHAQRRGRGSLLLDHLHQHADRRHLPCYLESTGTNQTALYARHGYQMQATFLIARGGPLLQPMWRPALQRRASGLPRCLPPKSGSQPEVTSAAWRDGSVLAA